MDYILSNQTRTTISLLTNIFESMRTARFLYIGKEEIFTREVQVD